MPVFTGDSPVPDMVLLECKVLLRPDEVMDILRISRSSVYRMIQEGQLEGVKIAGVMRVKSQSVRRLLAEPEVLPNIPPA
ncbi:MAG: helix-turn-helix domain-containing protein [Desulfatibacillum sp.]|nr:helix-turn-helix domain-containing protein [Desulfatibacillum sp.]